MSNGNRKGRGCVRVNKFCEGETALSNQRGTIWGPQNIDVQKKARRQGWLMKKLWSLRVTLCSVSSSLRHRGGPPIADRYRDQPGAQHSSCNSIPMAVSSCGSGWWYCSLSFSILGSFKLQLLYGIGKSWFFSLFLFLIKLFLPVPQNLFAWVRRLFTFVE